MKLSIEKVVYGGHGLARLPADSETRSGMSVFVPQTLPGEIADVEIMQRHRGYCIGEARQILEASRFRVDPPCPWYGTCGGCQLQHGVYAYQVELKREILLESLTRAGIRDLPAVSLLTGEPWGYRNRVRLQVQTHPEFSIGYRQAKSHRLTAIDGCPIAAPLLERCIRSLRSLGLTGKLPAETQEIEIFANHDQSELFLTLWTHSRSKLQHSAHTEFCTKLQKEIPQLIGAQGSIAGRDTLSIVRSQWQWGRQTVRYRVAGREYTVSAGSFFQINRTLLDEFVPAVVGDASGQCAWDLYAGVGLFSVALAERFQHVIAVESNPIACKDLRRNLRAIQTPDATMETIQSATKHFVRQALERRTSAPDLVLLDPPRAGAGIETCNLLAGLKPRRIVYVSCDPATLGRDLVPLIQSGYRLHRLQCVDMFPQTYHMETIAVLER